MRLQFFVLGLLAITAPSFAAGTQYANPRYSFAVSIPAVVSAGKSESENGDGATFHSKDGKAQLSVWGSNILDGGFTDEVAMVQDGETKDGWSISYKANKADSASFSGTMDDRIYYERMIPTCKGEATAHFRLEYPASDKAAYDDAIKELVASLKSEPGYCN